ncbi:MAG: hypothetical protein ACYTFW_09765 [Planctomycetota bacterium]|jgi:hypothetical protein
MNALKILSMIVLLAFVGIIAGCQEGHARQDNLTSTRKVVLEPSVTGFWQAKVVYTDAD